MKKRYIAIAFASALALSQTVCAIGAGSTTTSPAIVNTGSDDHDDSSSSSSSSSTTSTSTTSSSTASGTSTTTSEGVSISSNAGSSNSANNANVSLSFANNSTAATAGLPSDVVNSINSINNGGNIAAAVNAVDPATNQKADLTGYSALTKTSAIINKDAATNAVSGQAATATLQIPNLIASVQNIKILVYSNDTGKWTVVTPTVDYANKTVTFTIAGSCTVTVLHK